MPILADWEMVKYTDGLLIVSMSPPQAIGGWTIRYRETIAVGGGQYQVLTAAESSGNVLRNQIEKYVASGYNGASGITITDSGVGILQVRVNEADVSGRPYGAYPYQLERLDSGSATVLANGFRLYRP